MGGAALNQLRAAQPNHAEPPRRASPTSLPSEEVKIVVLGVRVWWWDRGGGGGRRAARGEKTCRECDEDTLTELMILRGLLGFNNLSSTTSTSSLNLERALAVLPAVPYALPPERP